METVSACLICNSQSLNPFLECKDYTISKEQFSIMQCASCGFRFTSPRPEEAKAGAYYQSKDDFSYTSRGLINFICQRVRKLSLRKKLEWVVSASGKQQGKLLDMYCGTGEFLNICKQNRWTVQGIEPLALAREFASKQYGLDVKDTGLWSSFSDNTFDVVTAWHVLEQVYDIEGTLKQVKRILTSNGVFIIALPNCSSADAEFYGKYWAAYDVPRHIWHFTPAHVKTYFEKNGFKLESVLPMPYDAYYTSILSEKYKGGNVNYGRAIVHGYFSNSNAAEKGDTYSGQVYILRPVK